MTGYLPHPSVRLIVCGNADRGDDGAALEAAAVLLPTLPRDLRDRLEVRRTLELRVEDLVDLPPDVACLITDTVVGLEPGEIVQLSLGDLARRPAFTPRSSHQLPIDLVLGLAGILRDHAVTGTFIGLAGHGFGYGSPLSRAARGAMDRFADAITTELFRMAEGIPVRVPGERA